MISLIGEMCQCCKNCEEEDASDEALETRKDMAEMLRGIMHEAGSEAEFSAELFERHYSLTLLRKDIENLCFTCLKFHGGKGELIAAQIDAYLTKEIQEERKVEILQKTVGRKVVSLVPFLKKEVKP